VTGAKARAFSFAHSGCPHPAKPPPDGATLCPSRAQGTTASGKCVTDYLSPSPALGAHRYIFILFSGAIPVAKQDDRICWDVAKFMNKYPNLKPVAMKCATGREALLCCASDAPLLSCLQLHVRHRALDCAAGLELCKRGKDDGTSVPTLCMWEGRGGGCGGAHTKWLVVKDAPPKPEKSDCAAAGASVRHLHARVVEPAFTRSLCSLNSLLTAVKGSSGSS